MYEVNVVSSQGEVLLHLETLCDCVSYRSRDMMVFKHKGELVFELNISSLWANAHGSITIDHKPKVR